MITSGYTVTKDFSEPTNLTDRGIQLQPRGRSFVRSFEDSLDTMVSAVTQKNSILNWYAGSLDKEQGRAFVEPKDLEQYQQFGIPVEFKPNETPMQLELRVQNLVKDNIRRNGINSNYGATNFIGGMIPELFNPVNYVPFGLGVKALRSAGLVAKGATRLNKAGIAMSRGQAFRAAAHETSDFFKKALVFNAGVEPLYYMDAQSRGRDYTLINSLQNVGFGTAIGTTMFAPILAGMRIRATNRVTERGQMFTEMYSFMERGDISGAANFAYKNSSEFRKNLAKQEAMVQRIKDMNQADGTKLNYDRLSIDEKKVVKDLLEDYYKVAYQAKLSKALAEDIAKELKANPKVNAAKFADKYKTQYAKIFDAFDQGDYGKLNKQDVEVLKRFAQEFQDELGIKGGVFKFGARSFRQLRNLFRNVGDDVSPVFQDLFKATASAEAKIAKIKQEPTPKRSLAEDYINNNPKGSDESSANIELQTARLQSITELIQTVVGNTNFKNIGGLLDVFTSKDSLSFSQFSKQVQDVVGDTSLDKFELQQLYKSHYKNSQLLKNKKIDDFKDPELYRAINKSEAYQNSGVIDPTIVENYIKREALEELGNVYKHAMLKAELANYKSAKKKAQFLRSIIDGQERSGIARQFGLENMIDARAVKEFAPILQVLDEFGLFDLFFDSRDPGWVRPFRNRRRDIQDYKMFKTVQNTRRAASHNFHKQLHQGLVNRKLPENWKGVEGLETLFELLLSIEMKLLRDLNKSGLNVNFRQDFGGISQKWDVGIIYTMGEAEFIRTLINRIDIPATRKAHGDVLFVDGKAQPFEITQFLKMWYKSLDPAQRTVDDIKVFQTDEVFAGRNVIIKPEMATQTMLDFSGYDNLGHLLLNQLNQRVKFLTMTEVLGTRPSEMLRQFADELPNSRDKRELNILIDYVTGLSSNPKSIPLATFGKNVQKASHVLFLGLSGPTTLLDIPQIAGTLQYQGLRVHENSKMFADAAKNAYNRIYVNDQQGMSAWFATHGAAFNAIMNVFTKRLGDDIAGKRNIFDTGADIAFKFNQMLPMTNAHEQIAIDVLTQALAMSVKAGDFKSSYLTYLKDNYGFTDADFRSMQRGVITTADGVERVSWDSVKSKKLSDKILAYQLQSMKEAVIRPDMGTNAQMTFGTRRGTPEGELVATATQYMNFPLQLTKVMYRRFKNGRYGEGLDSRTAYILGWYASMLSMSYVVTVIKDILKGKEPISLLDMSAFDMGRVVRQSGILPFPVQMGLDVKDFGPSALVAPVPGAVTDLVAGDRGGAVRDLTGEHIPGVGLIHQYLLNPHGKSNVGVAMGEGVMELETAIMEDWEDNNYYDFR
jgi:hypothetical protein